ncbi:MAG TPA: carboxypeptidase-like regulatory domain-containing protein, partial [Terriglobales bacterium]|nr:carboxypeptidase-like regulatory domain-containing protein [Terriglobales bacterium]
MKLQLSQCLWALAVCCFAATASAAQQVSAPELQTGTITGTAFDATGGTIPGASILLQGQAQGDERRAVTLDDGSFKLEGLKPGTVYHVTVSAPGFAQWTSPEIVLTPGQYFLLTGINLRVASVQVTVNVVPNEEVALQQMKAEEQQRIVGLIPNFYVAYEQNTVPLTSKMKFRLATRFATDPVTMAGFVVNAAIYQMSAYPSYQQGAKGYGQRLGATFAGGYTNIFVGDAILPSL